MTYTPYSIQAYDNYVNCLPTFAPQQHRSYNNYIEVCTCNSCHLLLQITDVWLDSSCSTNFTCTSTSNVLQSPVSCSEFAACSRASGAYECVCSAGYTGDGFTCTRKSLVLIRLSSVLSLAVSPRGQNTGVFESII